MPRPRNWVAASKGGLKAGVKSVMRPLLAAWGGQKEQGFGPEHWGLRGSAGRGLMLGETALSELLTRFGSPLFVVDGAQLDRNIAAFQSVPPNRERGCEVFYSYKTNPVPGVLRLLHEQGVGAEVISPYELWLARRLGVPPEHIIYNGPAKSEASLREAITLGIECINCNHREEIAKVSRIASELGRRARVGVRVTTEGAWSAQFGTPVAGGEALAAFAEAKAAPMLDVVGVHVHRGGMRRHEPELRDFLGAVTRFVDEVEAKLALSIELLNFGGSLGLATVDHLHDRDRRLNQTFHRPLPAPDRAAALGIERYVELIVGHMEEHYAKTGRKRPRLMLEPGRAMTGNAQFLLTSVLSTKEDRELRYAILDAGINIAESVRAEYHQLLSVNRWSEPHDVMHRLVGPICSPGDTLYSALRLPALAEGDALAIMDAGAYFVPFSTSFSFPRPANVRVAHDDVTLLRRRETFEDLVRYDELAG